MKLIVFVACFVIANALDQKFKDDFIAKLQEIGEKCSEETKASADDISDLIARRIPGTHEGKCMIFCFHKEFHIQKQDGTLDPAGAMASLEALKTADPGLYSKMLQVFTACGGKAKVESDPCNTAANLAQCAIDESKRVGIEDVFEI